MVAPLGTRPGSEQFSYHTHPDGGCRCWIIRRPVRSNRGPPRFGHVPVDATRRIEILPRLGRHHYGTSRAEYLEQSLNHRLRAPNDPADVCVKFCKSEVG